MNTYLANFNSKYLLTPEWRASNTPEETKEHEQVKVCVHVHGSFVYIYTCIYDRLGRISG